MIFRGLHPRIRSAIAEGRLSEFRADVAAALGEACATSDDVIFTGPCASGKTTLLSLLALNTLLADANARVGAYGNKGVIAPAHAKALGLDAAQVDRLVERVVFVMLTPTTAALVPVDLLVAEEPGGLAAALTAAWSGHARVAMSAVEFPGCGVAARRIEVGVARGVA